MSLLNHGKKIFNIKAKEKTATFCILYRFKNTLFSLGASVLIAILLVSFTYEEERSMIKTVFSCLMAAMAVSLFTTASVYAADEKPKMDPEKVFKKRDKDGDGSLSKEEFLSAVKGDKKEGIEKRFDRMDSNGDGKVSLEEFKTAIASAKKKKK